ncbi:MAG: ATP-dependent zinc metalloprotease FtsH [Dysgonamonadaceae bacterium]|mgnify:CR=1 FL=1|jgi:cell division protease FtsH|nr:ATP-dependent zinc metalloprotease FtsH [Dysgonamonadaceae bacterium]MDD3308914.1 ATP-dependent zinc metalloprotease FtsH [Dysgonamonadaceae bacterium]MDD3900231.1 ATP-dependent zinc metalloprotease FtsH [Dysgonamonadaceae bacterium]MDD4398481.1 ATP-dependent zinc metalloprotease FtsH [Dysgonamonadaceae bacterium]
MENNNEKNNNRRLRPSNPDNKNPKQNYNMYWVYLVILALLAGMFFWGDNTNVKEVSWSEFQQYVSDNRIKAVNIYSNKDIAEGLVREESVSYIFKENAAQVGNKPYIQVNIPSTDAIEAFLSETKKEKGYDISWNYKPSSNFWTIFLTFVPILLLIVFWVWMVRRMQGGGAGSSGVFSVGKSKAQLFDKDTGQKVTFKDVAGLSEAKEEVQEIVEFLKHPNNYTNLGGKIPKGALLVGPPGTGKTLLAKAVAGEANVPFFSISGSDFVEMFVGVGASRVRDLFKTAKEKAPCIVFIDEIDAVGRARGKNANFGSNDERESTLNQLLTEMDGFGSNSGVIVLAATNRADILDKALLRAGRFDRQIYVELPDLNDRKEIFRVHLRPIKIDDSVDVEFLARQTPGFSGADIANVCNEAALIAARSKKKFVQKVDFMNAVDRIVGGLEKKNKIITQHEKRSIAIHEAGHATLSWFLEHANPLVKVTIVPRGKALGAAWYLPEERQITTKQQMLDEMCATLGGRAAEDVFIGQISSGAMNDLERVTKQAYAMISYMGMSEKLPNLSYYDSSGQDYTFSKPYSDNTAQLIDFEIKAMIAEQYERAKKLLLEHAEGHGKLSTILIEKEIIYADDLEHIFGKRPWISRSQEILENKAAEEDEVKSEAKEVATFIDTNKFGSAYSKSESDDLLKKDEQKEKKVKTEEGHEIKNVEEKEENKNDQNEPAKKNSTAD